MFPTNMLPIQPPLISDFFDFKKKDHLVASPQVKKSFSLSWEDALWHLLEIHNIKKNSVVLVPEFFCGDVIQNMKAHGLEPKFYKVDQFLVPNQNDFVKKLGKYYPAVVVVFHAVGITNPLMKNYQIWKKHLPENSILIEDCVHRVIDPKKVKILANNHYLIDSLRKVVPIQGSWVYSAERLPAVSTTINILTLWYRSLVFFWWLVMQFFLISAYKSKNLKSQRLFNILAERSMKIGYDIIGDHQLSGTGIFGMDWLSSKLDFDKIYKNKVWQTITYKKYMTSKLNPKYFFEIPIAKNDYKELRGYPLGINLKNAEKILKHLRENGLLTRFELNDSPWSKRQKIVYLPMGLYVSKSEIVKICKLILEFK